MRRKKTTYQVAEENICVFSFDLKEVIEDECLTLTRREFQVIGSTY